MVRKVRMRDGSVQQWYICPQCGKKKLLRIGPQTRVEKLPYQCKLCGARFEISIQPEEASSGGKPSAEPLK